MSSAGGTTQPHNEEFEEQRFVVVSDIVKSPSSSAVAPPRTGNWGDSKAQHEEQQPADAVAQAFSPAHLNFEHHDEDEKEEEAAADLKQKQEELQSPSAVAVAVAAPATPPTASSSQPTSSGTPFDAGKFKQNQNPFYKRHKKKLLGGGFLLLLGLVAVLLWQLLSEDNSSATETILECVRRLFTGNLDEPTEASVGDCVEEAGICGTETVNACVETVANRQCVLGVVPEAEITTLANNYQQPQTAIADVLIICAGNITSLTPCDLAATTITACTAQLQFQFDFFSPSSSNLAAQQFFAASAPTPPPPLPAPTQTPSVTATATPSNTASHSATTTAPPTNTPSSSATGTPPSTQTSTPSQTPTTTMTITRSPSPSATPSITATISQIMASLSASASASPSSSATQSMSQILASLSGSASMTASASATPSASASLPPVLFTVSGFAHVLTGEAGTTFQPYLDADDQVSIQSDFTGLIITIFVRLSPEFVTPDALFEILDLGFVQTPDGFQTQGAPASAEQTVNDIPVELPTSAFCGYLNATVSAVQGGHSQTEKHDTQICGDPDF